MLIRVLTYGQSHLPKQTGDHENELKPGQNIVGLEPAEGLGHIGPDFPRHAEGDGEPQKFCPIRMF